MLTTISILLCKSITTVCNLFGRDGSVFPGSIIYKFNKRILEKIKYPKNVVVVTGSSGKGSTVSLAAHILEKSGKKVVWNKNGSNINNAIMTLILNNTKCLTHKLDADILLLEMDERYITRTFKKGIITHMLLTNITRDQPARNAHPEAIYEKIIESVDSDVHLIINADDPILNRARNLSKKITTYGISKTKYSSITTPTYAVDAAYCPKCHTKLKYSSYHYGHLGIYDCPKCEFSRGNIDYEANQIDLNKGTIKVDDTLLHLNKKVFFAAYYTLSAYTLCDVLNIEKEKIINAINVDIIPSKRMKEYYLADRKIEMLESKNENALSYLQSLNYIKEQAGKKTVIMGFDNVSRRYHYNDLSWLWDVNFELLKDDDIDKIFCIGRFKYDLATRLEYADIPQDKVILIEDMNTLIDRIKNESTGNIYTMVCFDMTEIIRGLLKENTNEEKN